MDVWGWHGALAAIKHAIPTVLFVRNHHHLAIATYMVDMRLATEMQANAGIQRKKHDAYDGRGDGDGWYDDNVCHALQSSEEKGRRGDAA